MADSKITLKYQTTIPKQIRERLGVGPRDVLHWQVEEDGVVTVTPAHRAFLDRQGTIRVGPGSVVEDIRNARRRRGSHHS